MEVRHEGPIAKKLPPRRSSFTSPSSPLSPHRRSRSTESNERNSGGVVIRDDSTTRQPSQTPSTLEEARDRIRVLSALTRIAGGRRTGQAEQGSLKVSVVMQIDRRIEQVESQREDGLQGTYAEHQVPWGHALSSTGGL